MKVNQMIQRKRNVNTSDSFVPRRLNTFGEEQTADNEDSPQSCVVPQIPGVGHFFWTSGTITDTFHHQYSSHFKLVSPNQLQNDVTYPLAAQDLDEPVGL